MKVKQPSSIVPWILLASLAVLFCFEWITRRREAEGMESLLRSCQNRFDSRFQEAKDRQLALLNPLRQSVKALELEVENIQRGLAGILRQLGAEPEPASTEGGPAESTPMDDALAEVPDEGLPEVPPGVDSPFLVKDLDLKSFFEDKRFNPSGRELGPVERLRAMEVLRTGQAWMDVLNCRIQVELASGMEVMREKGQYVEYASGEAKDPGRPGTTTAAEPVGPNRLRMFYFDPDEFPDIVDKKRRIEEVAENTVRSLLALVAD